MKIILFTIITIALSTTNSANSFATHSNLTAENNFLLEVYIFEKTDIIDCRFLRQLEAKVFQEIKPVLRADNFDVNSKKKITFLLNNIPHNLHLVVYLHLYDITSESILTSACDDEVFSVPGKLLNLDLHLIPVDNNHG